MNRRIREGRSAPVKQEGVKMHGGIFQDKLSEILKKFSDNTAIENGKRKVSYGELDERSDYIANWMMNKGIGREAFIGILTYDRVAFITSIIAILKAGSVFVPLDTANPVERLEQMVNIVNVRIIFTDRETILKYSSADLLKNKTIEFIVIDNLVEKSKESGFVNKLGIQYFPEDNIYIYFTSGTTGKPKAVIGKNKSLLHYIEWEVNTFYIGEHFRLSQLAAPGFDAFLKELFVALFSGATLCIPGDMKLILDSERLIDWVEKSGIHLLHCVPSLFRLLVPNSNRLPQRHFANLKFVFLSGEVIHPADIVKWYEVFGERIQIVNLYGTTETTILKTYYLISECDLKRKRIPIGKPIKGARVIILDKNTEVCNVGITGEIYIRTPYRTSGYYNDSELTKQRFIPNPFNTDPVDLIYKTGDLGRFLPDGNIEFLGRIDRQVKIHGIRVELEEIECLLLENRRVKEAVAVKKESPHKNNEFITAYITITEDNRVAEEELINKLKEDLRTKLPVNLVPVHVTVLEEIPKNSNGKVKYDALPDPFEVKRKQYVPPRSDMEKDLNEVWIEVLGAREIGIYDNFFELGGNSLNVMSLISKIRRKFDVRIPLAELFKNPTIEKQAVIIMEAKMDKFVSIEAVENKGYYTLSSAQRRLYFLQQMDSGSIAYNISSVVLLEGWLESLLFEKTFRDLIERQESFRTSFVLVDEEPVQRTHHMNDVEFAIESYGLVRKAGREEVEKIIQNFIRSFDLSQTPLFRVGLIPMAEGENILMVDMHHIISDGISAEIFVKDFMALYGVEEPVPLRVQYKDYSEWQNIEKKKKFIVMQEKYWLGQFDEDIPTLELPTDHVRPAIQGFEGSRVVFQVSPADTAALNVLALKERATLYIVLLAIYNIFLAKVSNQEVFVVGTPVSGRNHADLEPIIGLFVNTLALKNRPEAGKRFSNFLNEVREKTLAAFDNQEYLFEDLVDKVVVNRDLSRNPLFDTFFVLQNMDVSDIEIPALKLKHFQYDKGTSKFDLTLSGVVSKDKLNFTFEYSTNLFKRETIERFVSFFRQIISSILDNPGCSIAEIEVLPEEERKKLLYEFIDTEADYPSDRTIDELFEEQVEKNPSAIAVLGMNGTAPTSYRQLNQKSNQLAWLLREKGVAPGGIVAVMVERSLEMIAAVLSILKAGGAYLPVTPDYPAERIKFMLKDCSTDVLLTGPGVTGTIEFAETVINLEAEEAYHEDNHNLAPRDKPRDLAYVIYTSGSTGMPKGVMIEHRSLVNRLNWMQRAYPLNRNDTILHKTPFTFDVSVWELLWWAIAGAKVCLLVPGGEKDPEFIADSIARNNVTVIHFVPSMLNAFLYNLENFPKNIERLSSLKHVIASGETLTPSQVKKFNELLYQSNGTRLSNLYGPTEAAIDVSYFDCPVGDVIERVPIGKPIDNIGIVVLTRENQLQPVGIPGELCITGVGLARGYLNQPELTSKKFTANPFTPDAVMYRTGDLARWLPEGNLEFIGRIDHQVKIRGFRIEVGEIENRLLEIDGIKEALVTSGSDDNGDAYLCAYIVPGEGVSVSNLKSRLAESLARTLPYYMIPSYFVEIAGMPLTGSGKIDRRALPEPAGSLDTNSNYQAPMNQVEQMMAVIWKKVLGVDKVGMNDNFFQLGGHSLKASVLASRLHKELNAEIPLKEIFFRPTIKTLSGYIAVLQGNSFVSIDAVEKKEYYHLSSGQKRLFVIYQIDKDSITYNLPSVFAMEGKLEPERFEKTIKKFIYRHESLRTSFDTVAGRHVQKIHHHVNFAIEYYDPGSNSQSAEPGGSPGWSPIIDDFVRPFDLTRAPLLRIGLIETRRCKYMLMIDMHHIISDGASIAIMVREFTALYAGEALPPLRIQYKDFSQWQNSKQQKEALKRQEKYWLKQFAGEIPVLNLPTDYARPKRWNGEGHHIDFVISKEDLDALKRQALEEGVTLFMIVFSIYSIFLAKICKQEDIIIGASPAGRRHADLEPVIGILVNMLALRTHPTGEKTFRSFLREVKHTTLEAFENQDYQLEDLVDKVVVKRDFSRNPIFDVFFMLTNVDIPDLEMPGLKLEPYKYETKSSKYDLYLNSYEIDNRLIFKIQYRTKLFKEETVNIFITYFTRIISSILENPGIKLSEIKITSDEKRKELHHQFTDNLENE